MKIKIIFIVWLILHINAYKFEVIAECMIQSSTQCVKWKNQVFYYTPSSLTCFPHHTKLKTKNKGLINMQNLQIGDMILSYDEQSQSIIYKQITAWLHRSPNGYYPYLKIKQSQSLAKFMISSKHNIAIKSNKGIQYIFSQRLTQNTQLISFENNQLNFQQIKIIPQIIKEQMAEGMYAPFVSKTMNFFILSSDLKYLILVHCFANVNINPQKFDNYGNIPSIYPYLSTFDSIMNTGNYLGFNIQPGQDFYIHPFVSLLSSTFSHVIDWNEKKYEIIRNQDGIKLRYFHDHPYNYFRRYSIYDEQPPQFRNEIETILFLVIITISQRLI